jgi:hypothetical protein
MTQFRFARPEFREVLKDLAEARLHANHAGGHTWWQVEGAMREIGWRSRGERNSQGNPRYVPRIKNARPIPSGSVADLVPWAIQGEARRALVSLIRADRDLAQMTETPAITEARLWIGAAYAVGCKEWRPGGPFAK